MAHRLDLDLVEAFANVFENVLDLVRRRAKTTSMVAVACAVLATSVRAAGQTHEAAYQAEHFRPPWPRHRADLSVPRPRLRAREPWSRRLAVYEPCAWAWWDPLSSISLDSCRKNVREVQRRGSTARGCGIEDTARAQYQESRLSRVD